MNLGRNLKDVQAYVAVDPDVENCIPKRLAANDVKKQGEEHRCDCMKVFDILLLYLYSAINRLDKTNCINWFEILG